MNKKFNPLVYCLSLFIRILDSELCFKFNDDKNRDSGLPAELENLNIDYYYEVAQKIRNFKRDVKNNQRSILKLTAKDINHLKIYRLEDYSQQTEKYKAWEQVGLYEIRDNTLICSTFFNLYFFMRKMWHDEVCIHFWVEDGVIRQKKKVIYKLNQEYNSEDYKEVFGLRKSLLINFIFLPDHRVGRSISKPDLETTSVIKKIKSINVIENQLVITG